MTDITRDPAAPDSLDAAWAEAEAALPEGWTALRVFRFADEWTVLFEKQRTFGRGGGSRYDRWRGEGSSFAAALHALAVTLRESGL